MKSLVHVFKLTMSVAVLVGLASCTGTQILTPEDSITMDYDQADARAYIDNDLFRKSEDEVGWVSPVADAPFAFDELIYSWDAKIPEGEGYRLYLRVGFGPDEMSPWLYAGYWGEVTDLQDSRENPSFEHGYIAMDQLLLSKKADRYQFKLVDKGPSPLSVLPGLHVITTDNDAVAEMRASSSSPVVGGEYPVLDLPHRTQNDSNGDYMQGRCQSAALASAIEYFGDPLPLESIANLTWDYEYDYPGIWPRTIGAAIQHGYKGYIDRFRTWERVEDTLAQNRVILISMNMPESDDYIAPPYKSMSGHIIALNGITEDGRVIVTDSALNPEKGTRCQWLKSDIEKVWWDTKGAVGMVIYPPDQREMNTIAKLPEFPGDRR